MSENNKPQQQVSQPDCSQHKKDIAGISDMKVLAEMIGDLHYETLVELLAELGSKFYDDARKDRREGREKLASAIENMGRSVEMAYDDAIIVRDISLPFMKQPTIENNEDEKLNI